MRSVLWRWLRGRSRRHIFNFFPAFRGTGGRVADISDDFRRIEVVLPLNWRTRNYVGTIFGGSLYGAVDPFYMIMLIQTLGPEYIVWDKAASIRFRRPGKRTLRALFLLPESETSEIRRLLSSQPSVDRVYTVELRDPDGAVCAVVEKTVFIRRREPGPR
jgi:acyl-coenzyme A thioesterase PaaI-like protein